MSESFGTRQEAAEHIRRADVKWQPRENTEHLRPAEGLEPDRRIGPSELWVAFDEALAHLGAALARRTVKMATATCPLNTSRGASDTKVRRFLSHARHGVQTSPDHR